MAGKPETEARVNATPETITEWETLIEEYEVAKATGLRVWFQTIIPGFEKAFFVVAQAPNAIPQPEIGQNDLLTIEMSLTIEDFKGMDTKVAFA